MFAILLYHFPIGTIMPRAGFLRKYHPTRACKKRRRLTGCRWACLPRPYQVGLTWGQQSKRTGNLMQVTKIIRALSESSFRPALMLNFRRRQCRFYLAMISIRSAVERAARAWQSLFTSVRRNAWSAAGCKLTIALFLRLVTRRAFGGSLCSWIDLPSANGDRMHVSSMLVVNVARPPQLGERLPQIRQ